MIYLRTKFYLLSSRDWLVTVNYKPKYIFSVPSFCNEVSSDGVICTKFRENHWTCLQTEVESLCLSLSNCLSFSLYVTHTHTHTRRKYGDFIRLLILLLKKERKLTIWTVYYNVILLRVRLTILKWKDNSAFCVVLFSYMSLSTAYIKYVNIAQ